MYENVKDEIVLTYPFDGKARRAKGLRPNELDLGVSTACHVGFAIVLQKKTKKRKKFIVVVVVVVIVPTI